jgi:predicted RNA binding protein YcfA (HicA-like mRNA interferase family)
MPRKIQDYKAELIELGFTAIRRREGSHRVWKHPKLRNTIVITFGDGKDTPPYLEQQLKKAREILESNE